MASPHPYRLAAGRGLGDRLGAAGAWLAALLVAAFVGWLLVDLVLRGATAVDWAFLTTSPTNAGRSGGIAPVIVSTGLILMVCVVAAVPVALATALLLAEVSAREARLGRAVRICLDILAGTPSIVFGLFGNAFFSVYLGLGFSILSGGLTLACMVLPLLVRSTEEALRSVPPDYRLAAAALALRRSRTYLRVLLPAAAPGLAAGLVLGVGRALAETAALLFTSGYVDRYPESLLDSGRALSLHIYDLAMNVTGGDQNAYGTALVLVVLLLVINVTAVGLTGQLQRRLGVQGQAAC